MCRVSGLEAKRFNEGCVLTVPFDLSEDLANHFAEHDLDCGLKRADLADQDLLLFCDGVSPAQVDAVLKKWNGWPLLPRQ